jgi:DNA-binding MarR family transcriptional regulator
MFNMTKKEGHEYAIENGLTLDRGNFYRLFKSIARLRNINSTEKIVLSVILSYTDQGNEFYMSNNTLAQETGLTIPTIIGAIKGLRKVGFVKTMKKLDKRTRRVVGRTVFPQRQFITEETTNCFNEFLYEEYGEEGDKEIKEEVF